MYRDNRDRGSYSRSSGGGGRVGSASLSSSISLATPSFSSITMLNKGRSGGGGGSNWNDSGFGSAGQQPWGSSGNDRSNMGGRGGQQQQENVNASVYLDMDSAPTEFDAVTRVIGENGENLEYIRKTTGAQIQLQGRGTGIFNQKALHIYIEHNQTRGMERAEKLAGDLVKVVQEEYIQWQETNQQSRMGGSGGGNFGNSNQGNNQMYGNQNRGGRGADNFNTSNTSQSFNTGSSNRGGGSGYQDNQRGGDNFSSSNQRSDNFSAGGNSRFNDGGRDSGNRNMGGSGYTRDAGGSSGGGNQDRSSGRGNNWSDNNQDNYNRGGGSSDYNDRSGNTNRSANNTRSNDRAPARTNTIARLDASGNWHQEEPVQDNKRSGGSNFVDSGRSANSNQGRDTGLNRGYERDNDRGMGRNQDRGMDRNVDRNQDRGMDRNVDRGMDRNVDRGNNRNMDRGVDRNVDRGMDRNVDRGGDRNMDRGMDRNMDRSFDRGNNDRGMDRSMDRGMDRSMDRGMDRSMDRGNDRGMDRSMDRGNDRNMDRGNDRGMDRGMDRDRGNMDRGNSRNVDRDMDRGMSRNMDPPPAPKQPKYCDICDDTFPHDDAYKTHCNGVYHAEMVLEIKARNQRARASGGGSGGGGSIGGGGGGGGGGSGAPQQVPQPTAKPQRQTNLEMWTPDREGMAEQRWVYNQVAPLFERQLEQDILKKLQEYCRSVVSNDEIMPDRSQQHMNNYCKLCKITYNDLRLHIGSNMHITYYILRQIQMGVDTFCNYYGDVPIANVDTDGGRVLAIEALNWGPALPATSMGKPQLVERYKKLVVLSGPRNGYKCDLCRARCANMNFWVDHCTSVKHLKKMVSAMCALTREGFVREFPHTPVSPPYYAAACVAKLKDLQWHADIQVSNVQRVSQAYNTQGEWFDFRGPRGGNMGGGGPSGPRGGPSGPRAQRSGGPPPLMGAEAPRPKAGMEGGNQGQMRPRPSPGQPRPLMEAPVVPSMDTLSPADRDLVMQVSQITGLQDRTLVMSALEALRALDPNMIGALGSLSTQAMADVDPAMIETLLGAIGGGDAAAALGGGPPGGGPSGRSPSGPMRGGPPKRRMPMGRGGGMVPVKKGRF